MLCSSRSTKQEIVQVLNIDKENKPRNMSETNTDMKEEELQHWKWNGVFLTDIQRDISVKTGTRLRWKPAGKDAATKRMFLFIVTQSVRLFCTELSVHITVKRVHKTYQPAAAVRNSAGRPAESQRREYADIHYGSSSLHGAAGTLLLQWKCCDVITVILSSQLSQNHCVEL